jgi:hypothetical protein
MMKDNIVDDQIIVDFNQELDHLLLTDEVPAGKFDAVHTEMLSIAQEYATADLEFLSQVKGALRHGLLSKKYPISRPFSIPLRLATVSIALLILLVSLFALSPPFRAWAQDIIARVGNLLITNAPTDAEEAFPYYLTETPQSRPVTPEPSLSQEQASQLAGFPVLVPRNLPSKENDPFAVPWGATQGERWHDQSIEQVPNGMLVYGFYDRFYSVFIMQLKLDEDPTQDFPVGSAIVREVKVRGRTGYYIENAATEITRGGGSISYPDQNPIWQLGYENLLIWEEEDLLYVIRGDDELKLDDLLTIAESLSP